MSRRKRTVSISHWAALAGLADDGRSLATARALIAQGDGPEVVPSGIKHKTAIFRQINKEVQATHHDALEFPDGQILLLTLLQEDQQATVLQMPVTHQDESTRVPETERAPLLSS